MTQNCWEFKQCGREEGGAKVAELGVCPAATKIKVDGVNNGVNGGRACWAVAGTFCEGEVQGNSAQKLTTCIDCDFYKLVITEEGHNIMPVSTILRILHEN